MLLEIYAPHCKQPNPHIDTLLDQKTYDQNQIGISVSHKNNMMMSKPPFLFFYIFVMTHILVTVYMEVSEPYMKGQGNDSSESGFS